jgi:hypothetical protein
VELLSVVIGNIHPSIHAALTQWTETRPATHKATYEKINHTDPQLGKRLVQHSAQQLTPILTVLGGIQPAWIEGDRVRIIDGNHPTATQRRFKEIRNHSAKPLPGFT